LLRGGPLTRFVRLSESLSELSLSPTSAIAHASSTRWSPTGARNAASPTNSGRERFKMSQTRLASRSALAALALLVALLACGIPTVQGTVSPCDEATASSRHRAGQRRAHRGADPL